MRSFVDERRNGEASFCAAWRLAERRFGDETRCGCVLPKRRALGSDVCRFRHSVDRELRELADVAEDLVEVFLHLLDLVRCELEACEAGNMEHGFAGDRQGTARLTRAHPFSRGRHATRESPA